MPKLAQRAKSFAPGYTGLIDLGVSPHLSAFVKSYFFMQILSQTVSVSFKMKGICRKCI